MNREILRKRAARVVPLLLAVVCYVLCVCFGGMKYHTNDDAAIQGTLSGAGLGSPFPAHPFISVLISYPLAGLYRLLPGVNWWFLYSHLLTFGGLLAVNLCIGYLAERNRYPMLPAFCLTAVTDVAFFFYPISYISFTVVSERGRPPCSCCPGENTGGSGSPRQESCICWRYATGGTAASYPPAISCLRCSAQSCAAGREKTARMRRKRKQRN